MYSKIKGTGPYTGTEYLKISKFLKMGTQSLFHLEKDRNNKISEYSDGVEKDKIYIILIRDVIDRWKSGYLEEIINFLPDDWINHPKYHTDKSPFNLIQQDFYNGKHKTKLVFEMMTFLHDINRSNFRWQIKSHAKFWNWGLHSAINMLWELSLNPNVYFLELKDLSNPKFLQWLQEKDEEWKTVKKIPYKHKTLHSFYACHDQFWKEYGEGRILKDEMLFSPWLVEEILNGHFQGQKDIGLLSKKFPEIMLICEIYEYNKKMVYYIRNNHERYLKFKE